MNISPKIAIGLLLIVIYLGEISKQEGSDYPRLGAPSENALPPLGDVEPEGVGIIGPPSLRDPVIEIEDEMKAAGQQYMGTAFSIDDRGLWVTARHVTNGCDSLLLLRPYRRAIKVKNKVEHPRSDVSLLQTDGGFAALPIDFGVQEYNQEGFHFGFPRGEPGAVYSRLIGRRVIKTTGTRRAKEAVLVWAEKIRIPDNDLSLGGISGGPIVNIQGNVVGIHVAGSIRRGRSYSSMPKNINALLAQNNIALNNFAPTPVNKAYLNPADFATVGEELRGGLTVAQVICSTE